MDQLWTAAAWLLAAIGLVLALWALFWDRAKGRRRCPKCWYDLAGLPLRWTGASTGNGQAADLATEPHIDPAATATYTAITATPTPAPPAAQGVCTCPECGHQPRTESRIYRTRRRWRWALLGLGMAASPVVAICIVASDGKWAKYAPTTALIALAEPASLLSSTPTDPRAKELRSRITNGSLASWQSQIMFDRAIAHAPEIAARLARARETWPVDVPIVISAQTPINTMLFGKYWSCDVRARLLSTLSGEPSDWHPLDGFFRHDAVPLDLPPPNVNSIKVEVELSLQGKRLWRGVRMVPTRVSGTLAETLQPLSNPELDREVGVWLDPAAWLHPPNRLEVHVSNESREKVFGRYVAIGARASVFRNGELVGQGTLIASPQVYRECGTMQDSTSELIVLNRAINTNDLDAQWEIEITGDPVLALRDYDQFGQGDRIVKPWSEPKDYWSGTVRLPIQVRQSSY